MLIRWLPWLLCASTIPAQETESAAAVTASGRSMAVALDRLLPRPNVGPRTVMLLIDPGKQLRDANFTSSLQEALAKHEKSLADTSIGVAGVGVRGVVVCKPTLDRGAVVRAVAGLVTGAQDEMRNVYADVRTAVRAFAGIDGVCDLILVSLHNGDAEDDLELTVRDLRRNDVRFGCIASESYVADSYWTARPGYQKPRKTTLTGGDGAFVELPWGWLFQRTVANEVAPSGYACYGFNRLARETKGRVHLYAPPPSTAHQCSIYAICLFCDGEHSPTVDEYWPSRLARYAPSTRSRRDVYRDAGSDPFYRATLKAWQAANRAGLLRGTPGVKLTGNGLTPQRARVRPTFHYNTSSPKKQAVRAEAAAKACGRILGGLQKDLKSLEAKRAANPNFGIPRYRAMAEFTCLMLQLTKLNLTTFAGWCREVAPQLLPKARPTIVPPEIDPRRERRPIGIAFGNLCLCHGVKPFEQVQLPGGDALRRELAALRTIADRFELMYGHTPLGVAVHRAGIATFHLTYPGAISKGPRPRPKSKGAKPPVTPRGRPTRPGRTSGGSTGPKTGRK